MKSQLPEPDDHLLAAVLAWGYQFGVYLKKEMIAWADAEIERRTEVPTWLIDLSMSNAVGPPRIELQTVLHNAGWDADKDHICIGIYSSVPDLTDHNYDECHRVCRKLYEIVREIFKVDIIHPMLREISNLEEAFYGQFMFTRTKEDLSQDLREFLRSKRDETICNRLAPVRFVAESS